MNLKISDLFEKFDGFDYTNISVSINFMRPDYFGLEIFPMLSKIFEQLDLYILNLQEFHEFRHVLFSKAGLFLNQFFNDLQVLLRINYAL